MNRIRLLFQMRSLRKKLIGFSLLLLIVPSLTTGLIGWHVAKQQLNTQSKAALKSEVNLVNATIKELNKQVQAGDLSLTEAQTEVKQMILGKKEANGHRPINHSYNLGKSGYFFIVNNQGVEVAHPSIEGKSIWNAKTPDGVMIGQKIVKVGQAGGGFIQYIWPLPNSKQTAKKIVYAAKDPAGWGWNVVAGSYMSDYDSGATSILTYILITLGISIIVGIILTILVAQSIIKPVQAAEEQVAKVAGGDLTVEPLKLRSKDELSRLAGGLNAMTENLKNLISHITQTTEQVAASAEELSASSEESGRATEQITATIQQAADGAQAQSDSVDQAEQSIVQMVKGVEQIAATANTVSEFAGTASDKTIAGNEAIQTAVQKMHVIDTTVGGLSNVIEELGSKSGEIDEMLSTITNISNQTNLLALNAAIEAARAGESGRGFAVVADEVRKLADRSAKSAEQIGELIGQIQEGTTQAVSAAESTTQQMSQGLDAVNTAGQSFADIQNSVHSVSKQIQDVSVTAEQLSSGTHKLITATSMVTRVSEETAAGMQTVSASAEEQLAATEEITASAASLTTMAEQLQEMVNKFRV